MTRRIGVLSGKGGVGKTTLVTNLAYALAELGQEVIALDANLTTPHLGLYLGLHLTPKTLHDVLKGEEKIPNTIYPHPFGFKVVPASMNVNDLVGVEPARLQEVTLSLLGRSDFVILDCAPTLGREATSATQAIDEILLVTNPDLPSVVDALKILKVAEKMEKKVIGVVVNRVGRKSYELKKENIEEILGLPVLAEIPEDKNVPKSIALKRPVINFDPDSPASVEIRKLAHSLVGKEFRQKRQIGLRILEKLVDWMVR